MFKSVDTKSHVTTICQNVALKISLQAQSRQERTEDAAGRACKNANSSICIAYSIFLILVTPVGTWKMLYILIPSFSNFCQIKYQRISTCNFYFFHDLRHHKCVLLHQLLLAISVLFPWRWRTYILQ